METLSRGGRSIEETGDLAKITLELRGFLGELAGPIAPPPSTIPSTSSAAPTGLLNISSVAMQPIKISAGAVKQEEGIVQMKVKNILDDEEETQEERDTVLLSRGEFALAIIASKLNRFCS